MLSRARYRTQGVIMLSRARYSWPGSNYPVMLDDCSAGPPPSAASAAEASLPDPRSTRAWRGSFLLLMSRGVSSFLLSSHFLASVLVTCPRCAHRWSARSSSRVAFSASAVCVVLTLGSCSVLLANSMLRQSWEGNLHSITVSSAHCLFRLAGCPLHSGHSPLRRHRSVSTLVEASGLC